MAVTPDGNGGQKYSKGGIVAQGGKSTALSTSLVRRVTQGIRYAVTGVGPNDWFGPSQPIQPVAQEQAIGRVLDYQSGYNLLQRPREETESVIGFYQLRGLADTCNFLRLVIETRKDQMEKLSWAVQPRMKVGQKPSELRSARTSDSRIAQIEAFLQRPDGRNNWTTWLRQLVEEVLVTDAVSIYRRRNKDGKLYGLQQIDGATIKRVIDDSGLTPMPPDVAYQQILHGLAAVDYTADQLLYLPRNPRIHRLYGLSPVEQVVMTVNIALRRSVAQLNYFTEGNIPEALISVPPDWTPSQIREMQDIFDDMLKGNLAARSGAKFVPGGMNVQFMKEALLKDDFDEWLVRIICYAFSVSPTPFTKQTNRATAESVHQAALQEGLFPLQNWVKGLIDRVLAEDFGAPDLEFTWNDDRAMDPLVAMQINVGYVAAGLKTRNEIRSELGEDPIDDGDEVTITAGNTVVRLSDALAASQPGPVAPESLPKPGAQESEPTPDKPVKKADGGDDDATDSAAEDGGIDGMAGVLAGYFAHMREIIAAKVGAVEPKAGAKDAKFADVADELDAADKAGAFDMDRVFAPVSEFLAKRATDAGHQELHQLSLPAPAAEKAASYINQDAIDYAQDRAADMIGKRLVDGKLVDNPDAQWAITDTTRDGIRQLVVEAEKQGQSVQQLAEAIRKSALFSPARAKRIAQWELSYADNNGSLIAWKRSGVVSKKRSILGSEHVVCDECDANAGVGPIDLDADFPSGHQCAPFHPQCLPGSSLVTPCGEIAAKTKRWFQGDMVVIRTSGNHQLTVTPNHPILTDHGWIASGLLDEGDYVIGGQIANGMAPNVAVNHHNVPTRIEEITDASFEPLGMATVEMEASAKNFHGDGEGGKVAIIWTDSKLRNGRNSSFFEKLPQTDLLGGDIGQSAHPADSPLDSLSLTGYSPFSGRICSGTEAALVLGRHMSLPGVLGGGRPADVDPCFDQPPSDSGSGNFEPYSKGELRTPGNISADDLLAWNVQPSRHRIVSVEREAFAGFVYNMQTASGFYIAEGLVVHNCVCGTAPVIAKP